MTKKKTPALSEAAQRAERRTLIERAVGELEQLQQVLKKSRKQMRSLRLARDALLAELRSRRQAIRPAPANVRQPERIECR